MKITCGCGASLETDSGIFTISLVEKFLENHKGCCQHVEYTKEMMQAVLDAADYLEQVADDRGNSPFGMNRHTEVIKILRSFDRRKV